MEDLRTKRIEGNSMSRCTQNEHGVVDVLNVLLEQPNWVAAF